VDADELVIWTDVDGIYTANPNECAEARLLHELSYDEAHALAASGAKSSPRKSAAPGAETEMSSGFVTLSIRKPAAHASVTAFPRTFAAAAQHAPLIFSISTEQSGAA